MNSFNEYNISVQSDWWIISISLILIIFFAVFIYRITLPKISLILKIVLVGLRSLALGLIFLLLFEPELVVKQFEEIKKENYIFVDQSSSIINYSDSLEIVRLKHIIDNLSTSTNKIFTFSDSISNFINSSKIDFKGKITRFDEIIDTVKNNIDHINSVTIISDGIINSGTDPVNQFVNLGIPVNTVGIGDTTDKKDIQIGKILYNDIIYKNKKTQINTSLKNIGLAGENVIIEFLESNKIIQSKKVQLNKSGINNIKFDYQPQKEGEKNLIIKVSALSDEISKGNNSKQFVINVLDSKLRIGIVAGNLSPDVKIIRNILRADSNNSVNLYSDIAKVSSKKNSTLISDIDNTDLIFLIGFPSTLSDRVNSEKILKKIISNKKPFLIQYTNDIDFNLLNRLSSVLPNKFSGGRRINYEIDNFKIETSNDLMSQNLNYFINIKNFPPLASSKQLLKTKINSEIILTGEIKNSSVRTPLILKAVNNGQKSIAMNLQNFWKWKLSVNNENSDGFDTFINNSVKWLNAKDDIKQINISSDKMIYSLGEKIKFSGILRNDLLEQVSSAKVKLSINETDLLMIAQDGLYETEFIPEKTGEYSYTVTGFIGNREISQKPKRIIVNDRNLEEINTKLNSELLEKLALKTGGRYVSISNSKPLLDKLIEKNNNSVIHTEKIIRTNLWTNEYFLIIIVLLFSFEWFVRKRAGMI